MPAAMEEILYSRDVPRSAGNDFEHGGEVATRVKAILQAARDRPGRHPAALDRQLRGRDERHHVRRRGRARAAGPARRRARRRGRPRARGSRTSSWRCRRATPRPPPRCARGASAPASGCRTSRATATSSRSSRPSGSGTDPALRRVRSTGRRGGATPWPSARHAIVIDPEQVHRLRRLLRRPARPRPSASATTCAEVDAELCIDCGACIRGCRYDAVRRQRPRRPPTSRGSSTRSRSPR